MNYGDGIREMTDMNYKIVRNSFYLNANIIHGIRKVVGWPSSIQNCEKELTNSYANFTAWKNKKCVGYVNCISDGVSDALINNLIVHPEHQKQGIATHLLKQLVTELRREGVKFFNVVFEQRLEQFYKNHGFTIMSAGIMDFYDLSKVEQPPGRQGVQEENT